MRTFTVACFTLTLFIIGLLPACAGTPDYARMIRELASPKPSVQYERTYRTLSTCTDPRVDTALRSGLRDKKPPVRATCVSLLLARRVADAASLLQLALQDPATEVQHAAFSVLQQSADSSMLTWLTPLLHDPREGFRASVTRVLGGCGAAAEAPLLAALQDHSKVVRQAAIRALSRCGGAAAVEPLAALVPQGDRRLRGDLFTTLGCIGDPAVETLCRFAADPQAEIRELAVSALNDHSTTRVRAVLDTALRDPDPQVRIAALPAAMRDPDYALPRLYAALCDTDTHVKYSALNGLFSAILDEDAVAPLIALLDDADRSIQNSAVYRIQDFRLPRVTEALYARLQRPNPPDNLIEALGRGGETRIIPELITRISAPARIEEHGQVVLDMEQTALPYLDSPQQEAYRALCAMGKPAIAPLIQAAAAQDQRTRRRALEMLSAYDDPRARETLIAATTDKDTVIRKAAIWALSQEDNGHDARSFPALIRALDDTDEEVRAQAAYGLMGCQDPRIIPPLTRLLRSRNEEVRAQAAWTLADMDDPRVLPLCCDALRDRSKQVRQAAACGVGDWIRNPRAVAALVSALTGDDFASGSAAEALAITPADLAVPALTRAIRSKDPKRREAAAEVLGYHHDLRASQALIACLTDAVPDVRGTAEQALLAWCAPKAISHLRALLGQTRHAEARLSAIRILATMGTDGARALHGVSIESITDRSTLFHMLSATQDVRAPAVLQEALHNPDVEIRQAAARALGVLGSEQAVALLLAALRDNSDSNVRYYAAQSLITLKATSAVEPLIALLKDNRARAECALALGEIGDARAADALLAVLPTDAMTASYTSFSSFSHAVDALARLEDRRVADRLLVLLQPWQIYVPRSLGNFAMTFRVCIQGLGKLRDPRAIDFCTLMLREHMMDQSVAIDALGSIGGDRAVDALLGAVDVARWSMHEEIAVALGKITAEHLQEKLTAAMHSPRWIVRHTAVLALANRAEPWRVPLLTDAQADPQPQVSKSARKALTGD